MKNLFIAATFLVAAGSASASTSYDYTGSNENPSGPALSCEALGILNDSCVVTHNAGGLGVNGSPDTTPGQIDGFPYFSSESLTLDFGRDVEWNSITFGLWDVNDDVRFTYDGGTFTYGPGNSASTVALGGVVSQSLKITAYGQLGQDGWVGSFWKGFEYVGFDGLTVASVDVNVVPLPAAGWMLFAGLGGIAALKRRKRAT